MKKTYESSGQAESGSRNESGKMGKVGHDILSFYLSIGWPV